MAVTLQFGAVGQTGIAEGTFGYLQTYSKDDSADETVAMDAVGEPAENHFSNKATTIEADYVFDTTTTAPTVGAEVTLGTDKYSVMSVNQAETNDGYTTLKVTLKRYTTNGVPANA
jgi:hypothetical protein